MSDDYVSGYAIRRNSTCEAGENQCTKSGATWGDYQACCPGNSFCFDSNTGIPNIICCENQNNCTAIVADTPSCANQTWNLFDYKGGFCCEQGDSAFGVDDRVLVGCTEALQSGNDSFIDLKTLSTGSATATSTSMSSTSTATSTTTSTTTSTSSPSTSAAPSNSSSGPSTNVGAIAGGVVGGVAGVAITAALLFFFLRRRKQQEYQPQAQTEYEQYRQPPSTTIYSEAGDGLPRKELDGQTRSEVSDTRIRTPQELPAGH